MIKRKNKFGIKCLFMYPMIQIVDPATQARLQLKATVEFYPGDFLPEFVEVQNSLRQKLENQKLPVEAVSDALIDFFNEYGPEALKVRVEVVNNNMFFPIAVIAESGFAGDFSIRAEDEDDEDDEPEDGEGEEDEEDDPEDETETE
jgi:hypothetical protein